MFPYSLNHPSIGKRRRPDSLLQDDSISSYSSEQESASLQAFKRLKVNDEEAPNQYSPYWNNYIQPPPQLFPAIPQYQQQQQQPQPPGKDSTSEQYSSATVRDTRDSDYKSVNSVLGELHRQRMLREHDGEVESSTEDRNTVRMVVEGQSILSQVSEGRHSTSPMNMMVITGPSRQRKVKHLYTDSKLG